MAEANVDVVLKSIHDPSCVYHCQHLTTEGVDMMEPATDVPEGWTFLRQLPEKVWKMEVWELIVTCFDHLSEVHAHMSSFAANMLSLAKIASPETFDMVTQEPWYRPHQVSSCSSLALSQTQVFQWRHHQGGLHYV